MQAWWSVRAPLRRCLWLCWASHLQVDILPPRSSPEVGTVKRQHYSLATQHALPYMHWCRHCIAQTSAHVVKNWMYVYAGMRSLQAFCRWTSTIFLCYRWTVSCMHHVTWSSGTSTNCRSKSSSVQNWSSSTVTSAKSAILPSHSTFARHFLGLPGLRTCTVVSLDTW